MALVCELCSGSNFVKEGGMFVCQDCGAKYSVEEARNLMSGGGAPAAPSANTERLNNLLELAQDAFDNSNNEEAESYANKVLELDPKNAKALLIKGEAVAWRSTVANVRFDEMIKCWEKALANVAPEEKQDMVNTMVEQMEAVSRALVNLTCKNFGELPTTENATRCLKAANTYLETATKLMIMCLGCDWPGDNSAMRQYIADKLNSAAVNGSDYADNDFGPDRSDKYKAAWERWLNRTDNCITLLESAITLAEKKSTLETIIKNMKIIQNAAISSQSYSYNASLGGYYPDYSLTDGAKTIRRNKLAESERKVQKRIAEIEKKENEAKAKAEAEQRARNEAYWAEHAEEKAALDARLAELKARKAELDKQVKDLDKQIAAINKEGEGKVPAQVEQEALWAKAKAWAAEKSSLGLFKGKEKKALQAQIDEVNAKAAALHNDINAQRKARADELKAKQAPLKSQLDKIKAELSGIDKEIKSINSTLSANH